MVNIFYKTSHEECNMLIKKTFLTTILYRLMTKIYFHKENIHISYPNIYKYINISFID